MEQSTKLKYVHIPLRTLGRTLEVGFPGIHRGERRCHEESLYFHARTYIEPSGGFKVAGSLRSSQLDIREPHKMSWAKSTAPYRAPRWLNRDDRF